ncbi:MAG: hypothetical protein M1536_01240 [Firmicutes bacterium]|nr:hypothetical protein [Bacillota bacterium]
MIFINKLLQEDKSIWRIDEIRVFILALFSVAAIFLVPIIIPDYSPVYCTVLVALLILYYGVIYNKLFQILVIARYKFNVFKFIGSVGSIVYITLLVHFTGGAASFFKFLFIMECFLSGLVLRAKGVYAVATLAWIFYGAAVVLDYFGWVPGILSPAQHDQFYGDYKNLAIDLGTYLVLPYISASIGYLIQRLWLRTPSTDELKKEIKKIEEEGSRASFEEALEGAENLSDLKKKLFKHIKEALLIEEFFSFAVIKTETTAAGSFEKIAKIIRSSLRGGDAVIRFEGRFYLIFVASAIERALIIMDRIMDKISHLSINGEQRTLSVEAGAGMAVFPDNFSDMDVPSIREKPELVDILMERASDALTVAESTGKNRIICYNDTEYTKHKKSEQE